ncbi:glycoside hydrolase family 2 protein [Flavivirga algicola]|uniref:Glycoside hydrolase family 2 protein n=1 Tax=Flavivirga algicola TaxID=2729136 RepID=A0ABX1RRY2_9FLAO|nr:glycoside hydrolase family 2 TIM barrel-domain containing protein [Flavivirga algicola]NMH86307.1 glycoside hydrolase family 2 protein [Flavivirga algicola]
MSTSKEIRITTFFIYRFLGKRLCVLFFLYLSTLYISAQNKLPEYSTAGFFEVENSGRKAYNFNVGWRFIKSDIKNAQEIGFDDSSWEIVNVPHGLESLPVEASGGVNYQGPAWYRKHFSLNPEMKGKILILHFEGVMGKSKVYLNGILLKEHFGGYLPIVIDISNHVSFNTKNVIAIRTDNSDDGIYPPGKPQSTLDFSYFGGIYRDAWLISTNKAHITDANLIDKVADGGVFVRYENLSKQQVDVVIRTNVENQHNKKQNLTLVAEIKDKVNKTVATVTNTLSISRGKNRTVSQRIKVLEPNLWTPDIPYLYDLVLTIKNKKGEIVDGYRKRIGIRTIHFDDEKGFFLNGEHYSHKLLGANRHQDFAIIGNALPNALHWRDVKKLRDAGFRIIRNAHYPQDPAFMDACDELGMFIIDATPGWQFWNKAPIFEKRVYSDIRQMVRRDRNHPSVIMWEPILNETHYPDHFAKNVHDIVHEEYPYPGAFTACDHSAKGSEHFDIVYRGAPKYDKKTGELQSFNYTGYWEKMKEELPKQAFFTREWGDNVDDWSSHNSPSRASRNWGERPQIVQALHYAKPIDYDFYNLERLYFPLPKYIGGTIWHSFDHQRGYNPVPFYGGIMDAFRQPKYAYHMFTSQRDPDLELNHAKSGPYIYLAHELTPFSSPDVVVFSNCDEVRLTFCGEEPITLKADKDNIQIPHPYYVFKDAYNFMTLKKLHRTRRFSEAYMLVEGLKDGQVIVSHKRQPSKKATKLVLHLDNENMPLIANGSDVVAVVASIVDEDGIIKRLNNEYIQFEIEGEGRIIGENDFSINPSKVEWGTAPILVQTTNKAGKIKVKAKLFFEGINKAVGGDIEFESIENEENMIYSELPTKKAVAKEETLIDTEEVKLLQEKLRKTEIELRDLQMKQVEKDQDEIEKKRLGKDN